MREFKPLQSIYLRKLEVIDGDTVEFDWNGYYILVRLTGINAPETYPGEDEKDPQPFSIEAKERLCQLVAKSKELRIDLHQNHLDTTGNRLLGHLFVQVDGKFVNASHILLAEGLAIPYGGYRFLSEDERREFQTIADDAKSRGVGVYSLPGYITANERFHDNLTVLT